MAKPKGYSTMCWLGIIQNGFSLIFYFFAAAYQAASIFISIPSLVALGILDSEAAALGVPLRIFISLFQLYFLYNMLFLRVNRIRGLLIAFGTDILITCAETLATPDDLLLNATGIILAFTIYAIPTFYFRRKRVYEYLDQ